jgi:hypothetical protein
MLLELLVKNPSIYKDAVKYTLACHNGIMFSSLFDDWDPKEGRETMLRELQNNGSWSFFNDPKGGLDVFVEVNRERKG